jgi:hypothetical protein
MNRILPWALLVMTSFHFACRTTDPEPIGPGPWKEEAAFTYFFRNAIGSGIWEDQLFVLTEFTLAEVQPDGSALHRSLPVRARAPLPLTRDYIVLYQAEPGGLLFVPTDRPDASPEDRIFLSFEGLGYGNANSIEQHLSRLNVAVNNRGQVLLPLKKESGEEALFLFNVQLSADRQRIEEVNFQKIVDYPDLAHVSTIQLIGDSFLIGLVSQQGYSFLVYPDGQTKKVSEDPIYVVYPATNEWYGWGSRGGTYLSRDNGESWTWLPDSPLSFGIPDLSVMSGYATINDIRVTWNTFNFFELSERADQPGFQYKRLNNDGLSGHIIIEFRDWKGKVYAITPSGVYSRTLEDFFTEAN